MIVVDTSALIAMIFGEPRASEIRARLLEEQERLIAATSVVEFGAVLAGRQLLDPSQTRADVKETLSRLQLQVAPVTEALAEVALDARIRFGKGFGAKARLNFGDSFAYALAKIQNAPLLFVGDDFAHTDVVSALTPG